MNLLISGAGIAGLATALELGGRGHAVTVVEHARHLRLTGTPIDIRGDAVQAAARMGLLTRIRAHRVDMSERTRFVDSEGEPVAPLPPAEFNDSADDVELLRADLVRILADALPDTVTVRFGDAVEALDDDGAGVGVRFASGRTGRYDVVIGADGQHSGVRGLVFGPEPEYTRHLGVYFALADFPGGTGPAGVIHNVPGRMAGLFRYGGKAVAVLQFRSPQTDHDDRDPDVQKKLLAEAFADQRSWRIPELLDAALADPDLYFTSASQIHLPAWHRGRVVLVGDAGYCPAYLSGRGTSLALTGAWRLAEELDGAGAAEPHHPESPQLPALTAAFARYEARHRPHVDAAQARAHLGRERILPPTWAAIAARDEALRTAAGKGA